MNSMQDCRNYLKSTPVEDLQQLETDQGNDLPEPPLQKKCPIDSILIDLTDPKLFTCGDMDFLTTLRNRKSRRDFSLQPLTLEELSFLLWSVQGVKKIVKKGYATLRTVPSAGARHPFETYLAIFHVASLKPGLYRYLPLEHKLIFVSYVEDMKEKLSEACFDRSFASDCAVTFIWTALPYRTEWRYSIAAYKYIALDAGHMCQNLYLAAETIHAGTCAIASYDQEKVDALLGVDGKDEFTIYLAPVGKQKND